MTTAISYRLRRSARARRVRLVVGSDGQVVVTVPHRVSADVADRFVMAKAEWIRAKQALQAQRDIVPVPSNVNVDSRHERERARRQLTAIVQRYAVQYGFRYTRLSIRNQRSRWGSCSPSGSLSFNIRLAYLPTAIQEYVVVHELCHLRHLNHAAAFWQSVESIMPDFRHRRSALQNFRLT